MTKSELEAKILQYRNKIPESDREYFDKFFNITEKRTGNKEDFDRTRTNSIVKDYINKLFSNRGINIHVKPILINTDYHSQYQSSMLIVNLILDEFRRKYPLEKDNLIVYGTTIKLLEDGLNQTG